MISITKDEKYVKLGSDATELAKEFLFLDDLLWKYCITALARL